MSELPELVDLSVIFPSLHIDLKYATADNITGAPIYREARCLLHTEAVTALAKASALRNWRACRWWCTTRIAPAGAGDTVECLSRPAICCRCCHWFQSQSRNGH